MSKCTIYYGMSGTLKLSTINSLHKYEFKVFSDTKPFFMMDEMYFNWSSRPNDAHLAIHRLLTLDLPGYLPRDKDIVIERGVTDNLFSVPNRKIPGLLSYSDIKINDLVNLEERIIKLRSGIESIEKVLLIMNDKKFIESKVLNNRYRRSLYPDVDSYLKKQDEYTKFTMENNSISRSVVIDDAKDYIINRLKVSYE